MARLVGAALLDVGAARAQIIGRRAGGWSLRQIARKLVENGMPLWRVAVRLVREQERVVPIGGPVRTDR